MDFEKVFQIVVNDFNKEDVAYALIGGFAVGVWGIMRATTDLDFIILLKDSPKIEKASWIYWYWSYNGLFQERLKLVFSRRIFFPF